MRRRELLTQIALGGALARTVQAQTQPPSNVFFERRATGRPHEGKVLLALQAHSDDIPLSAAGTVAKLIEEGYTGYLVRASNDDMGDAPNTCSATNATTPNWFPSSASRATSTSTTTII
jgi:hypothetical protein